MPYSPTGEVGPETGSCERPLKCLSKYLGERDREKDPAGKTSEAEDSLERPFL